jgi:hypothetical protein
MMAYTQVGYQTQDEPNYRQVLRPIGAYLDRLQARFVTLGETEDGFVWHCFPNGDLTRPLSGMIAHTDVPLLMDQLKAARRVKRGVFGRRPTAAKPIRIGSRKDTVCPEGYEETFRSLGNKLDVAKAIAVLIVERKDTISVNYHFPTPGYLRRDLSRTEFTSDVHEDNFNRDQVARLIATSRSYRNNRYFH